MLWLRNYSCLWTRAGLYNFSFQAGLLGLGFFVGGVFFVFGGGFFGLLSFHKTLWVWVFFFCLFLLSRIQMFPRSVSNSQVPLPHQCQPHLHFSQDVSASLHLGKKNIFSHSKWQNTSSWIAASHKFMAQSFFLRTIVQLEKKKEANGLWSRHAQWCETFTQLNNGDKVQRSAMVMPFFFFLTF